MSSTGTISNLPENDNSYTLENEMNMGRLILIFVVSISV